MYDYVQIEKAAGGKLAPYTDDSTPRGYFAVTANIVGIVTTYLLKGSLSDLNAAHIVGRVELQSGSRAAPLRFQ